jgi:hypothetical protein
MPKPFLAKQIDRYGDCALVTIVRVTFTETGHKREVLEQYETLSRGATASARKSMQKYSA